MSRRSILFLLVLLPAAPAAAQSAADAASSARIHAGPLGLTPSFALRDVGIDTNVFRQPEDPKEDFTATLRPQLDGWLRLGRATLQASGALDVVYFKRYSSESSANPDASARLQYRGNRLGLFAGGRHRHMRQTPSFEIDLRVPQRERSLTAGGDVRLGGKTTAGVAFDRMQTAFDEDAALQGAFLHDALSRRETTTGAFVAYDVTPLTSVLVRADFQRDVFAASSLRNGRRIRMAPGVELKPFALVAGTAVVGYQRFEPDDSALPPVTGTFASVALSYTLLGRTRFAVQMNRDVEYSYQPSTPYYVITGLSGSISQAITSSWQVTALAGRQRLDYGAASRGPSPAAADVDSVYQYGAAVAWRLGPDLQVGFNGDYQSRRTADPIRHGYQGLRAGTFITWGSGGR